MTQPLPPADRVEATLHGGPAGGRTLVLGGTRPNQWPEYICLDLNPPGTLPAHYRHIAAGVYEHQGACAEMDHSPLPVVHRCPGCGCEQ